MKILILCATVMAGCAIIRAINGIMRDTSANGGLNQKADLKGQHVSYYAVSQSGIDN